MAGEQGASETTATPVVRADGTIDFRDAPRPMSERLCAWALGFLWLLVPLVLIATILWY